MTIRVAVLTHVLFAAASISNWNEKAQAVSPGTGTALPVTGTAVCPRKQSILNPSRRFYSRVLDDKTATHIWEPWSYPPICVAENKQGKRAKLGDKDSAWDKDNEKPAVGGDNSIKYCLFTNSVFGEHGISILARPEAAAKAADILWEVYHSAFPSPETVQYLNLEPAYRVVDMPDKGGKGVVATRHIKRLETFMVDYASIIGDLKMWGSVSQKEGHPLLDRAAQQLIDPEHVLALSRGAGGDGVEGVIRANTFRTHLNGVPLKALFPKISRINHACQPNSMLRFSAGGVMAGVAAFRDIKPGEEITISYIPLTDTSKERKTKLQAWNFTCSCALCKRPAAQIDASDKRREKLARGIDSMVDALQKGNVRGAIDILRGALKDLEKEGLEARSAGVYEGLARIYWALGQKKTARAHARKAVDYHADFGDFLEPRNRTADLEIMLAGFS